VVNDTMCKHLRLIAVSSSPLCTGTSWSEQAGDWLRLLQELPSKTGGRMKGKGEG
jgi:hypothetical protein